MADAQLFGKYVLMRKLAAGGMGEVFLAKQQGPEGFEKFLVIKRILSHHTDNPDYVDMFFAEARLAAKMSHSNIVQIFEMGEIDGSYFIAMEYVNGKSMKDIIDASRARKIKIEPAHIAEMVAKLAAGLGYAHNLTDMSGNTLNIIHRDVNPHNALVTYGGETKVIDFGIAKSDANEHKTETGTIKGKFVYMSPEQSAAEKIDKRSDIFAIGIVLYEMLAGENPFQKANIVLSLDAIQRYNPPPPSTIDPAFAPFDAIVMKALAKKADNRYQDCSELVADLQRALISGAIPRPQKTLSQAMRELFSEQIEKEQRFMQDFAKGLTSIGLPPVRAQRPTGLATAFARQETMMSDVAPPVQSPLVQTDVTTGSGSQLPRVVQQSSARRRKARTRVYGLLAGIGLVMVVSVVLILSVGSLKPAAEPPKPAPEIRDEPLPPPVVMNPAPVTPPVADKPPAPPVAAAPEKVKGQAAKPARPEKKIAAADDAKGDGGVFMIYSTPSASIFRDGQRMGAGGGPTRVEITKKAGVIRVGDASSPFQISFNYKLGSKGVELSVDSSPWAILKRDGLSLGKTPQAVSPGATTQRFEFLSPAVQGSMIVAVRFSPG